MEEENIFNKYNSKNIPKIKYNLTEESTETIIETLKNGKLSKDAISVGYYILKFERQFEKSALDQIEFEIINSSDKSIFNSFGLKINETRETFKMEFNKTNRSLKILLTAVLTIIYLLIILPFSIERIIEQEYLYVFVPLILIFPFFIFKTFKLLKNKNHFHLEIDRDIFTVKSISTNYEKYSTKKANVIDLKIIENQNYELKLIVNFKNQKQIEILSELYSNLDKENIREYLTKVKSKINQKLHE